jgi:uncharacterized MnhB-related membrane protein
VIAGLPVFDLLLAAILVWLVSRMVSTADRFKAVVLYITFGMVMVICWVRLNAPDLALVEAAIGAGLTGALLLDTLGRLEEKSDDEDVAESTPDGTSEVGPSA